MFVRAVDDKASDTLVVVSGEGSWTGSSTLPHLHQRDARPPILSESSRRRSGRTRASPAHPPVIREEPWTTSPFSYRPSPSA